MKAIWNGTIIAESNDTVVVEGNHYFPENAVTMEYLSPSDTKTTCPWKGIASYYTINVDKESNVDAAWYYPEPKEAASNIKGHIAFWRGVDITEQGD
jgi:uncharacterized protein (DUF427 family)